MKKITLLILLVTAGMFSQNRADKFILNCEGFTDFVVLEFDNKPASKIFTNIQKWGQYNIRHANYSKYSEIENEYLTYRLLEKSAVKVGKGIYFIDYDLLYDLEIRIKDNKLRVDFILIAMPLPAGDKGLDMGLKGGLVSLYNNQCKPRKIKYTPLAIAALEDYANGLLNELKESVNGKSDYIKKDW